MGDIGVSASWFRAAPLLPPETTTENGPHSLIDVPRIESDGFRKAMGFSSDCEGQADFVGLTGMIGFVEPDGWPLILQRRPSTIEAEHPGRDAPRHRQQHDEDADRVPIN
jgi:hypothetical protein